MISARSDFFERAGAHLVRGIPTKVMPSQLTKSIASITFDDFAKSAWRVGGAILSSHRVAATYYVAGSLAGLTSDNVRFYDADDLAEVHAAGHEIGSHTYAHYRVKDISSGDLLMDADKNGKFIRDIVGDVVPETFAYPYGSVSLRTKLLFGRRFACCRGTEPGINRGLLDLGQLKVVSLERRFWTPDVIDGWIADACRRPSWTIFYTHDVVDHPSQYGSTPAMLDSVLTKLRAAGIEVMTVKNALARACLGADPPEDLHV